MKNNLALELRALKELQKQYKEAAKSNNLAEALDIKQRLDVIKDQCITDMLEMTLPTKPKTKKTVNNIIYVDFKRKEVTKWK